MSTDLTFITNEPGNSLRDRFAIVFRNNTRYFDCLVGYFYISGFYKLHPSLAVCRREGFSPNSIYGKIAAM
jgi:hypothetical protein